MKEKTPRRPEEPENRGVGGVGVSRYHRVGNYREVYGWAETLPLEKEVPVKVRPTVDVKIALSEPLLPPRFQLLPRSLPLRVPLVVPETVVDAAKCGALGTQAHVGDEVDEALRPEPARCDGDLAIGKVTWVVRAQAALHHRPIRIMSRRIRQTMPTDLRALYLAPAASA